MIPKYAKIEERFVELEQLLADPQTIANQNQYQKLAKEYSDITALVLAYREYKEKINQTDELNKLLKEKHDKDFEELARHELQDLKKKQDVRRKWFIFDASGKTLGRFASELSKVLRGKHRPDFTPYVDSGDGVIVINADKP